MRRSGQRIGQVQHVAPPQPLTARCGQAYVCTRKHRKACATTCAASSSGTSAPAGLLRRAASLVRSRPQLQLRSPGPLKCPATTSAAIPICSFSAPPGGSPREQPTKSAARDLIVELRRHNHLVSEINESLRERGQPLSAWGAQGRGLGSGQRRRDEGRRQRPRATIKRVADAALGAHSRSVRYSLRGMFLFVPQLLELSPDILAVSTHRVGARR
jgi:hypothetical protein